MAKTIASLGIVQTEASGGRPDTTAELCHDLSFFCILAGRWPYISRQTELRNREKCQVAGSLVEIGLLTSCQDPQ